MDVIKEAKDFLLKNNIQLEVEEDPDSQDVAYYLLENETIYINTSMLLKDYPGREVDYIAIIISHELGHHFDKDLGELIKKTTEESDKLRNEVISGFDFEKYLGLIKMREVNAWDNGWKYVPNDLKYPYEMSNRESLERRLISTSKGLIDAFIEIINNQRLSIKESYQEIEIQREMIKQLSEEVTKIKFNQAP